MISGIWQNVSFFILIYAALAITHVFFLWLFCLFVLCAALRKKLEKASKLKDCDLIGRWKKSVINHLYWSAVSTPDGNGELIKAKWLSVVNHIHNKHKGHGRIFPVCKHKRLGRRARKIEWFKPRKYAKILTLFFI